MYYYLIYNSSFNFIVDNRLFSTILYGSILYIISHAILHYCNIEILTIIKNYYWSMFVLDIISFTYCLYKDYIDKPSPNNAGTRTNTNTTGDNLNVSFNLLKNKINNILTSNNSDISSSNQSIRIIHNPTNNTSSGSTTHHPIPPRPIHTSLQQPTLSHPLQDSQSENDSQIINDLSHLRADNMPIPPKQATHSTPISLLRGGNPNAAYGKQSVNGGGIIQTKMNIVEPDVITNDKSRQSYDGGESVAGSDVGSMLDLDDFEKTL